MKIKLALIIVPLLGILATPAMAGHRHQDGYDRFDRRLDRQHHRIKQGVRSGELTRIEARKLRKQHRRIVRLKYRYMDDGYLSHYERRKLTRKLDKASRRIHRLKHNQYVRYYPQGRRHIKHHRDYDAKARHHKVDHGGKTTFTIAVNLDEWL